MTRPILLFCVFALTIACKPGREKESATSETIVGTQTPHIERYDSELNSIITPDAEVEIIADGFEWTEGPLWIDGLGLLFCDIPPNKIYLWTQEEGHRLYLTPSGYTGDIPRKGEKGANGLLIDSDGNLVLCQHGDRRVAKMNASINSPLPLFTSIVDNYQGKKFNSPNDACFNSRGDLYFTDPPYGLARYMDDPLKELNFQGVYKYSQKEGLALLTDELSRPNGIALSSDESTLYVANSDPEKAIWMEYRLDEYGSIQEGNVFYDATSLAGSEEGLPDGLKLDSNGNIFASGPGGLWIFNPKGKVLGKIRTGQATSNCAIGNGGSKLYITADMYVMQVNLKAD
jgi:gluconolactonase